MQMQPYNNEKQSVEETTRYRKKQSNLSKIKAKFNQKHMKRNERTLSTV